MENIKAKLDGIIDKYMDAINTTLDEQNIKEVKSMISKLKILVNLRESFNEKENDIKPFMIMQMMEILKKDKDKI